MKHVRRFVRLALPAAGTAALWLASPIASAQSWILDPRIAVGAIYNDNFRLTDQPGQEIEVTGGAIDAALTARKESQVSMFAATPRIRSTWFPDQPSEESTDYYFNLLGEKRTARTRTRLAGRFADENVVFAELLVADFPGVDLGQTVSGDAGRVSVRNRRQLFAIEPAFLYDWTERRHLTAQVHYVDVSYDEQLFEQIGYTDIGGQVGMVWDLTQRSTLSLNLIAARYSPDDNSEDTRTGGVVAEWRTAASEVMNFYFRAGSNRVERDTFGTQQGYSATTFNGGVGVAWNFQITRIVLDALTSAEPSSQGAVVDREEVRLRFERDFSPRLSGILALRGIRTEGLDNVSTPIRSRKYYTGRAGFEWRMSRQMSVEGTYEYRWQEFEDQPNSATSNGVILNLVYQPRRLN